MGYLMENRHPKQIAFNGSRRWDGHELRGGAPPPV